MHAGLGPASIIHASFFPRFIWVCIVDNPSGFTGYTPIETRVNGGHKCPSESRTDEVLAEWAREKGELDWQSVDGATEKSWKPGIYIYIILLLYIYYYLYIYISIYRYIYRYTNTEMRSPSLVISILHQPVGLTNTRMIPMDQPWSFRLELYRKNICSIYIYAIYIYIHIYIYKYIYIYPSEVSNFESKTANIYTYIYIYTIGKLSMLNGWLM